MHYLLKVKPVKNRADWASIHYAETDLFSNPNLFLCTDCHQLLASVWDNSVPVLRDLCSLAVVDGRDPGVFSLQPLQTGCVHAGAGHSPATNMKLYGNGRQTYICRPLILLHVIVVPVCHIMQASACSVDLDI